MDLHKAFNRLRDSKDNAIHVAVFWSDMKIFVHIYSPIKNHVPCEKFKSIEAADKFVSNWVKQNSEITKKVKYATFADGTRGLRRVIKNPEYVKQ